MMYSLLFCFCVLARFSSLVSFYGFNDFVYIFFRHNNTPHSVVSNFCYFECLLYGEHINLGGPQKNRDFYGLLFRSFFKLFSRRNAPACCRDVAVGLR